MAAHSLPRHSVRRARSNPLLQLGWLHFWLLAGILGGILGLIVMVFVLSLSTS